MARKKKEVVQAEAAARKKKIKNITQLVVSLVKKGEVFEGREEDVARAAAAVERRHPNFSFAKKQRRIRIRLRLLGIVRQARAFQPFGGVVADLTKGVEEYVTEMVDGKNAESEDES